MTSGTNSGWFVVQTHIHCEVKASLHLERQGYSVYLPRYMKRRRHARRVENVAAPLFPRYLFVEASERAQRWRAIQSTVGVSHVVCNGENPAVASTAVVSLLKSREDASGLVALERQIAFISGDKILVTDGVFSDCFGLFEGASDHDRVIILLDLLGRKVKVVLDQDFIAAA